MEAPSNNREELWGCIPRFFSRRSNILHLPSDVVADILSRLPIKTLAAAKCVCKSWLNLVSGDTHLAKLHRQRSAGATGLLLRCASASASASPILYFGNIQINPYGRRHSFEFKFPEIDFTSNSDLRFVNSCNGLVCFHSFDSSKAVIVNPITGEFVAVPLSTKWNGAINYRLGFNEKESRFSLLQVMYRPNSSQQFAEICTFEKGSEWRGIGDCPYRILRTSTRTESVFLEHKLHLDFVCSGEFVSGIACFDFENEQFGVVPTPPHDSDHSKVLKKDSSFGVFRGRLFVSLPRTDDYEIIDTWVMKEYGVEDTWEKVFSIPSDYGSVLPFEQLENGGILVLVNHESIVSFNPSPDRHIYRWGNGHAKFLGVSAFSPTLLRLKDALAGYEACIHDAHSKRRNSTQSHQDKGLSGRGARSLFDKYWLKLSGWSKNCS